jgi:hypothetical protein
VFPLLNTVADALAQFVDLGSEEDHHSSDPDMYPSAQVMKQTRALAQLRASGRATKGEHRAVERLYLPKTSWGSQFEISSIWGGYRREHRTD